MNFREFLKKWNAMPSKAFGFLSLDIDHPLNFQIGYHSDIYKSLVIMDTGIVQDIPSSFAIKATNAELQNGQRVLEFQLLSDAFEDLFLRLCWDMIDISKISENPLAEVIARYLNWQRFLQYSLKETLSIQMQKGLLGELLYIIDCTDIMRPEIAVNAWVGPEGSDQDFVFSDSWTEVKAVSLSSNTVHISSLQQFDQEKNGQLTLYTLERTTPGNDRVCLVNTVEKIRFILLNDIQILDRFETKLFKYGYRESEKDEYEKNQYRLLERRDYYVDDKFPKITRHNIANEIVDCTYSLSIPSLEKFRRA